MHHGADTWHLLPEYSEAWEGHLRWWVCPKCLWLSPSYDPKATCGRPPGEPVRYGYPGGHTLPACAEHMTPVPSTIGDALWSALAVGGLNAVVAIVGNLKPEQVGLPNAVARWHVVRDDHGR